MAELQLPANALAPHTVALTSTANAGTGTGTGTSAAAPMPPMPTPTQTLPPTPTPTLQRHPAPTLQRQTTAHSTYDQILKSSILIGGSSLLVIAIGVIRTKAIALILGPTGFGLMGLYGLIADLARSLAQVGVSNSGVRQIAEAHSSGDAQRVARTITVLRRLVVLLGLLGAALLAFFSGPVATLTFGNADHANAVALLAVAVFFSVVAGGQTALIQGMRRINDLAMLGVWGAVFGVVVGVPMVYWLREDGLVPSLVAVAAMSALTSWWYSRKVRIESAHLTARVVRAEATSLLTLGVVFMASGLLMMGVAYAVRLIVLRHAGLEGAGLYQSAWALGGLYVGFVLQSMGADFYPRLVATADDPPQCNRLVNEQAQISMLLAGPGVLATLACAPWVIAVFYSAEFAGAVAVLRWICLGMTLRVITWPMGFIIVARQQRLIFFATELAWSVVALSLAWWLVPAYGVAGAGMAFAGSYVFHGLMIYPIVASSSGFRWSPANMATGAIFVASIGSVFAGFYALPFAWATPFALLVTLLSAVYSVRTLLTLVSIEAMPKTLQRLLVWCGLTARQTPGAA